ncbi:MAG: protein kinase family protein [Verrucomicrobia bacterium]|nr:protein kinase family protein [Verrucomicrobiota bacterium]
MKKVVAVLFLLASCCHVALFAKHARSTIDEIPKKKNLTSLEKIAHERNNSPLLHAVRATRALYEKYDTLCCKKLDFLKTSYFIESHRHLITTQPQFFKKRQTNLKHTIEYDPNTGHIFILLDSKKAFLGAGKKKTVFKSILYGQDPKIVARGEQAAAMDDELHAHHALKGVDGLMTTYAFTTHKGRKTKYNAIYSDLYHGTFRQLLQKNKLSFRNKLIIIRDILKGLESIHSRNYVHRDLHANNYLFKIEQDAKGQKTYRVVIADLGRTIAIGQAEKVPVQGARRLYPPEGFKPKKLAGTDYFATDIYATGCVFYWLYHNTRPKWQDHYIKDSRVSTKEKRKILVKRLKRETSKRRQALSRKHKRGSLTMKEDTEFLILQMLRKRPHQRGDATHWRQEAERILDRYGIVL